MLKTLGILHAAGYVRRLVTNRPLITLLEKILMTTQELSAKLDTFIARETKLDDAVKALVAAAKSASDVPPEIADKVAALEAAFTTVEADAAAPPAA